MTYDLCCIGHITLDKVVTPKSTAFMPGGTAFYFSVALAKFPLSYLLVTSLAGKDAEIIKQLGDKGIEVKLLNSTSTLCFENIYSEDQNYRTQRVTQKADPFSVNELSDVQAEIFHLGSLLSGDMPADVFRSLSEKGKISLDVQGFLRKVEDTDVIPIDWEEKMELLPFVHYLKANEYEMEVLTGQQNICEGARLLHHWGAKEVIITCGSNGSVVFDGDEFQVIPAFQPQEVVDATGCGDTYMAGYLYQRTKGADMQEAGEFAAAMATLKIETSGPFIGTVENIQAVLQSSISQLRD